MRIGNFQINFGKKKNINEVKNYFETEYAQYSETSIVYAPFTGEKNAGELGIVKEYYPDYYTLSARSWQCYLESEIAQIVINNYLMYTVGDGLKLQSVINETVLSQEGLSVPDDVRSEVEARWKVFSQSRKSDFKEQKNIHFLLKVALKHAKVGGDCLIILRNEGEFVNVQIIDGHHITSPIGAEFKDKNIRNGILMDEKGKHVSYFIQTSNLQWTEVKSYGDNTGRLQAFMLYGSEYRVDNNRGIPVLSTVLETIKKIDRYKEATVGSAEERQKIAYFIQHGKESTGENPIAQYRESLGKKVDDPETEKLILKTKQQVAATTGKTAINMPNDSTLEMLESKNELYFKDFYETNFIFLCAALMIPPEVALNKYDSNYSASRAAIKSWENRIKAERWEVGFNYYQPIYNMWLEIQVLNNKINLTGYMKSLIAENFMAIEAYQSARWVGANLPHIDPLKEVMAIRKALGDDITPLTTYEFASEFLNFGDWETIIKQVKNEIKNKLPEKIITKE